MKNGTYIGNQPELKSRTAILKDFGDTIEAQFDDPTTGLGHGWYTFSRDEWEIEDEA